MSEVVDIHKKKGITPHFDIYIGRKVRWVEWTYDSKWGNYYYDDLEGYEKHVRLNLWGDLEELKGKILGCWCVNTKELTPIKCHGQILMKLLREKKCEHLNIIPRGDLSYVCKDCGYDTYKEVEGE